MASRHWFLRLFSNPRNGSRAQHLDQGSRQPSRKTTEAPSTYHQNDLVAIKGQQLVHHNARSDNIWNHKFDDDMVFRRCVRRDPVYDGLESNLWAESQTTLRMTVLRLISLLYSCKLLSRRSGNVILWPSGCPGIFVCWGYEPWNSTSTTLTSIPSSLDYSSINKKK
ncbi:hypothetical protein BS50DRAFT_586165 [Corynespora cassiicola Philippines]|uniref:Uncharacterized protein n=1 Tax=Corynespora cassiicola Philippines TaxID=1448308 RepID=A0A2T2NTH7_CORCC|nr:hypothetical protein BS50DRAFT_586165 [Corynespora cassiicola Philippines]